MRTAQLAVFGFTILTALGELPSLAYAQQNKAENSDVKGRPKIPILKETTYFTEPLDTEGYVDFPAAINERLGQGVTAENNANVLLWQAFGPHPYGANMPRAFFRWMQIGTLPEEGDYLLDFEQFLRQQGLEDAKEIKSITSQLDHAGERPWTAAEYPQMAAWLKANEKPLALAVAASKRPKYFSPLVAHPMKDGRPAGIMASLVAGVQRTRVVVQALSARAMLALGEGRPGDAWHDLLACHRLGRLVGRGGTLIEFLVGVAVEHIAVAGDLALLERGKLEVKQFKARLAELQALPARDTVAEKIDLVERCSFLETVQMVARYGPDYLASMAGGGASRPDPLAKLFTANVDWEPALRNGNRWFDRLTAALRVADRAEREKQLDGLDIELKELRNNATKPGVLQALSNLTLSPTDRGKRIGDILVTLLVPALRKVQDAGERMDQVEQNLLVAFALAAYHRENGKYPAQLDALAPAYLARVPTDRFSGKALIYRPGDNGYLLYSVGVNGKDDGGRTYGDEPAGDDLVVKMPLREPRSK
jgi:hypothetical protein